MRARRDTEIYPGITINGGSAIATKNVIIPKYGHGVGIKTAHEEAVFEDNLVYQPASGFHLSGPSKCPLRGTNLQRSWDRLFQQGNWDGALAAKTALYRLMMIPKPAPGCTSLWSYSPRERQWFNEMARLPFTMDRIREWRRANGYSVATGETVVRRNLIVTVTNKPLDLDYSDFDSGFFTFGNQQRITLTDNHVAGSENQAYAFNGFSMPRWPLRAQRGPLDRRRADGEGRVTQPFGDLTLWQVRSVGVWGYCRSNTPRITNVKIADAAASLWWGGIGPSSIAHTLELQTVTIDDSLFVGRSESNSVCPSNPGGFKHESKRQQAILLPVFGIQGYSISPSTCGPLGGHWLRGTYGMEHPSGSEPPLAVETRIKRTAFARYSQSACGKASVVETNMNGGMESADAVPPVYFEEISIDDESRANLAHLPPPKRSWILPTKCVVMDCDGPKHVLLHDLDGSLTGNGADASILARAEFMHERRSDASKYTWYNIPTKMLYDPAPLNDPGDRGYDMSNAPSTREASSRSPSDASAPTPTPTPTATATRAAARVGGGVGLAQSDGLLSGRRARRLLQGRRRPRVRADRGDHGPRVPLATQDAPRGGVRQPPADLRPAGRRRGGKVHGVRHVPRGVRAQRRVERVGVHGGVARADAIRRRVARR